MTSLSLCNIFLVWCMVNASFCFFFILLFTLSCYSSCAPWFTFLVGLSLNYLTLCNHGVWNKFKCDRKLIKCEETKILFINNMIVSLCLFLILFSCFSLRITRTWDDLVLLEIYLISMRGPFLKYLILRKNLSHLDRFVNICKCMKFLRCLQGNILPLNR